MSEIRIDGLLGEDSIPFYNDSLYHGLGKISGVLSYDDNRLLLDYKVSDSVVGLLQSNLKNMSIFFTKIKSITLKKKCFSARMYIELKSANMLSDFPGADISEIELKIKGKHKKAAEEFLLRLKSKIIEAQLDDL